MARGSGGTLDGALRVLGRLVALLGLAGLFLFLFGIMLKPLLPRGLPPGRDGETLFWILTIVAVSAAHGLVVALLERGDWRRTGFGADGWQPLGLLMGVGLAALVAGAPLVVARLGGPGSDAVPAWDSITESLLLLTITASLADALLLRGYMLGLLREAIGPVAAASIGGGVAALLALRPASATAESVGVAFLVGLFLGAVRLRTGSLAAAWIAQIVIQLVTVGSGGALDWRVTAPLLALVTFLLFWKLPQPQEGRGYD